MGIVRRAATAAAVSGAATRAHNRNTPSQPAAAPAAGLTAAGLDAGTAVSAVLLYRMITFWAPTVPGYWAFTKLTKDGLL